MKEAGTQDGSRQDGDSSDSSAVAEKLQTVFASVLSSSSGSQRGTHAEASDKQKQKKDSGSSSGSVDVPKGPCLSASNPSSADISEEQGSAGSDTSGDNVRAKRNGYPGPLSDSSSPSTIGHKLGPDGKCNPCVFNLSKRGCRQGADCEYCHAHMATEARIPHRPRKETRLKAKRNLDQALAQNQARPEMMQDQLQKLAATLHKSSLRA
ncbi:Slc35a3 [Symbiodinium sp. CCMP2592]|nr:Slc35a3 [Symbiodinium sp. CCMP2592]